VMSSALNASINAQTRVSAPSGLNQKSLLQIMTNWVCMYALAPATGPEGL